MKTEDFIQEVIPFLCMNVGSNDVCYNVLGYEISNGKYSVTDVKKKIENCVTSISACMNCINSGIECSFQTDVPTIGKRNVFDKCERCVSQNCSCESYIIASIVCDAGNNNPQSLSLLAQQYQLPVIVDYLHHMKSIYSSLSNWFCSINGFHFSFLLLRRLFNFTSFYDYFDSIFKTDPYDSILLLKVISPTFLSQLHKYNETIVSLADAPKDDEFASLMLTDDKIFLKTKAGKYYEADKFKLSFTKIEKPTRNWLNPRNLKLNAG